MSVILKVCIALPTESMVNFLSEKFPFSGSVNLESVDWAVPREFNIKDYGFDPSYVEFSEASINLADLPLILQIMKENPDSDEFYRSVHYFKGGIQWNEDDDVFHVLVDTFSHKEFPDVVEMDYVSVVDLLKQWETVDPYAATVTYIDL